MAEVCIKILKSILSTDMLFHDWDAETVYVRVCTTHLPGFCAFLSSKLIPLCILSLLKCNIPLWQPKQVHNHSASQLTPLPWWWFRAFDRIRWPFDSVFGNRSDPTRIRPVHCSCSTSEEINRLTSKVRENPKKLKTLDSAGSLSWWVDQRAVMIFDPPPDQSTGYWLICFWVQSL